MSVVSRVRAAEIRDGATVPRRPMEGLRDGRESNGYTPEFSEGGMHHQAHAIADGRRHAVWSPASALNEVPRIDGGRLPLP